MKKKIIIILAVLLLIILFISVKNRIENRTFYTFKASIENEFSYVQNISLLNHGPHCTIILYLKKESCNFEQIEPLFIKVMLNILESSNFKYFNQLHYKETKGELAFIHVSFRQQGKKNEELYKFDSYKDFQKWEIFKNTDKCYYVSDYLDPNRENE